MRTIGLIGGMSWESTAVYYCLINTMVREQLVLLHSDFDGLAAAGWL